MKLKYNIELDINPTSEIVLSKLYYMGLFADRIKYDINNAKDSEITDIKIEGIIEL